MRGVLEEVCKEIAADASIDESLRNELEVDSDTQGVAGQPPIAETILNKIDAAAVLVADMTFTAKRIDGRPSPNANVLIEYGWALKSLGYMRVISVMNELYGTPSSETLPFDLAHSRWPMRYLLPEDASSQQKAEAKRKLVATLKSAIRTCLEAIPSAPFQPPPIFPKAASKEGPARFRSENEELGFYDGVRGNTGKVFLSPGPAIWLRVMPSAPPSRTWDAGELKAVALKDNTLNLLPLFGGSSFSWLRAEDGWGVYLVQDDDEHTESMVFVFQTGEIWGVDTAWLAYSDQHMPFIEDKLNASFANYVRFVNALGVSAPYQWIAGLTGVKGRQLVGVPVQPGHIRIGWEGPICVSETVQEEGEYTSRQSPAEALLPLYKKIFAKCGVPRPAYLNESNK